MSETSIKLDIKDKKLLYELEQNSRQSIAQLGRQIGLSKETTFHRMKSLEQRGIIKKYLTEINVYRLGYQFYPLLLKYQNTTPSKETEIYEFLRKHKFVAWLTKCEGAWDINLTLIAKSNLEINEFLNDFLNRYSEFIADKHIFITTEINYFKRGFWLNKEKTQTISTHGEKTFKIDEIDLKLLKILSNNSRMSLVEIGEKIKANPKIIAYRIKKLEKIGIIQGSRVLVDFAKTGYKFYKVFFSLKNFSENNSQKFIDYCKQNQNIIWATKTIGFYDLSIEMEVKDVEEFRNTMNEIKNNFSGLIKKHESLLIFEESIMNYLPN